MSGRAPIERWSRSELEDRFHSVSDQFQSLKQNNHRLQREMKILHGRVGASISRAEVGDGPRQDELLDDLHRSNQVLSQKLKVLKHQLLSYTAANSRPRPKVTVQTPSVAGTRPATATASGQQQQQRRGQQQRPPPLRRRPQSATVAGVGGRIMKPPMPSQQRSPAAATRRPASSGISDGLQKPLFNEEIEEESAHLQQGTVAGDSGIFRQPNEWTEEIVVPAEQQRHQRIEQRQIDNSNIIPHKNGYHHQSSHQIETIGGADGGRVRELQRQGRTMTVENEELRFSLEKSEQKLTTLRREYDRIAGELEKAQRDLRSQSDSLSSFREEAERKRDTSSKSAEITDREVAILKEECRQLKTAHERLVARSLEEESSGKAALEQLARVRVQLEQSSSEGESERRQWEAMVQRLRAENARLERELRLIESGHRRNQEPREDLDMNPGQNGTTKPMMIGKPVPSENRPNNVQNSLPPNPLTTPLTTTNGSTRGGEEMLNKLFADVMSIVDTHVGHRNGQQMKLAADGNANFDEENRWQQMYENVYQELEKVRRLLISEHEMNSRLKEELRQETLERENLKTAYEHRLAEMEAALAQRGARMGQLERELHSVAEAGDVKDMMLGREKNGPLSRNQSKIESTELCLHLSKLSLSPLALEQAQSAQPSVFVAIEFFDFELQTSGLVNGPEADFDLQALFELTVSDLFIHYIQTEGIGVELYIVRESLNYELWAQAKIPLTKLLSTKTPTLFRGELRFLTPSSTTDGPKQAQQTQQLLATLAYTIQAPFSLLRALGAQRRRMAAAALLPLLTNENGTNAEEMATANGGMDFNELVIQIHRCTGLDMLKGWSEKDSKSKSSSASASGGIYIAYEFFHFPVHMSKMVSSSSNTVNPVFDESHAWKLPAGSEAVHKYLMEQDLLIYIIKEDAQVNRQLQARDDKSNVPMSSRALAYLGIPLFPLSRNQKIRGSFPLHDRADDSIAAGASIDISIYWKFAYVLEGDSVASKEPKLTVKKFAPTTKTHLIVEEQQAKFSGKQQQHDPQLHAPMAGTTEREGKKMEDEKSAIVSTSSVEQAKGQLAAQSAESSEDEAEVELSGEELRRRLFSSVTSAEEAKKEETKGTKGREKEEEKLIGHYDPDLEFGPSKAAQLEAIGVGQQGQGGQRSAGGSFEESSRQISEISNIGSPPAIYSSSSFERDLSPEKSANEEKEDTAQREEAKDEDEGKEGKEEYEDDEEDKRSDATYTMEEGGASELIDEFSAEPKEVIVIQDEDIRDDTSGRGRRGREDKGRGDEEDKVDEEEENGKKKEEEEELAKKAAVEEQKKQQPPEPAKRRSLLGELPPIQTGRKPILEPEIAAEEQSNAAARRTVEFTDPLHSSIPPSELSSSFADDLLSGESAHSSRSNGSESESSADSQGSNNSRAEESSTPTNEEKRDDTKTMEKEDREVKEKPKPKQRGTRRRQRMRTTTKTKARRQIDISAVPSTPAIRVRQRQLSVESSASDQQTQGNSGGKNIVQIRIGRLRVLEHSPLLHPQYESGQVFVEWNFLDIEREQCETEGTVPLPRHHSQQIDFDQQRSYELNSKRVALLKQWTELNIRLTFTLVLEQADGAESDDLGMGELDLMEVLNDTRHTLIMRNVDNLAIAVLEVEVNYSDRLMQQIRDAIDAAADLDEEEEEEEDEEELIEELGDVEV